MVAIMLFWAMVKGTGGKGHRPRLLSRAPRRPWIGSEKVITLLRHRQTKKPVSVYEITGSAIRFFRLDRGRIMSLDFQKFAEQCLRLADQVQSVEDKSVLLDMAQAWIRLADQGAEVIRLIGKNVPSIGKI